MQFLNILALALTASAAAVPLSDEATSALTKRQDRGSYTVSGLGSRKQAILNAGGNTLDLAIAMLEDERMSTGYIYGKLPPSESHPAAPRGRGRSSPDHYHRRRQDRRRRQLWRLQAKLGHAPRVRLARRLQGPEHQPVE